MYCLQLVSSQLQHSTSSEVLMALRETDSTLPLVYDYETDTYSEVLGMSISASVSVLCVSLYSDVIYNMMSCAWSKAILRSNAMQGVSAMMH